MMPNIHNSIELQAFLERVATDAITQVSKDISDNDVQRPDQYDYMTLGPQASGGMGYLQKMIWEKVYTRDYFPNMKYYTENIESGEYGNAMPTFQFFRAFKWKKLVRSGGMISRELFYDWQSMKYDPKTFLHGNPKQGDMRDELADMLNVTGKDRGYFGGKEREPFWNITMAELFSGDTLRVLFEMAMSNYTIV
jgi:hypothetical protein